MEANRKDLPEWLLERYLLGELGPTEHERVRLRLENDADAARRLRAISESNAEILRDHPPAAVTAVVGTRLQVLETQRRHQRMVWLTIAVPLAAMLCGIVYWLQPARNTGSGETEVTRVKGLEPRLLIHRKSETGSELLAEGASARERDLLQLSYMAAGSKYGLVLSLDGRGAVTLHLPDRDGAAAELQSQGEVALPHSYELDDAPGFERFFLVTSDTAFDTGDAVQAARALARSETAEQARELPLPARLKQFSLSLRKVNP